MEEGESEPVLSRKEMRKQKLMEYLAAKGKLKLPTVRPNLSGDCLSRKPVTSAQKVVTGKENKAPADRFRRDISKGQSVTARSGKHPETTAFAVSNKGNSSKVTGLQNSTRPAEPKPNRNPLLTRTYDVVSSKSSLNVKKQANTGIQASGKAPLNTAPTARVKSNSKFTFDPSSASSFPMMTVGTRISLGPLVKTKTGLTPAVIQPRAPKPNLPHASVTAANTTTTTTTTTQAAKKAQSSTTSSLCASQRSGMSVPSAARARNKVQGQSKLNSKPALGSHSQPSSKRHLSSGLKPTSISLKSTAASLKPVGRGTASKSAGQPANRSTKPGTETKGDKNGQPCKAAFQTSSRPTNWCTSRPVGGLKQPAVTEMGKKTKITKEAAGETEHRSSKAPPPKTGAKSRGAPLMSQTVPPPARTISLTVKDTKTPKVQLKVIPQTEGKKPTAAQVERMKKLQEWREAKGVSYKRPPMQVKPQVRRTISMPQPFWASMNEEDEAYSLICAVDRSLADCIKLLTEGCSPDRVKELLSRLPVVSRKFAKYWICRARLMEQEGNLDVLPMFEEAVGIVLEPVDELRTVVFDILKKKDEIQASEEKDQEFNHLPEISPECGSSPTTPKPVKALIYGERGDSSVVKYKITATPGGPPSRRRESVRVNGQEVRFFTPVRRSVRIEKASLRYPTPLQDHDLCVKSYNELLCEEEQCGGGPSPSTGSTPVYVYRENEALKDKVFVQLVCDDTD